MGGVPRIVFAVTALSETPSAAAAARRLAAWRFFQSPDNLADAHFARPGNSEQIQREFFATLKGRVLHHISTWRWLASASSWRCSIDLLAIIVFLFAV